MNASHTRHSPRTRLLLQALEDRRVPALFTVTNLADSGAGSLRDAVAQANALAGADTIDFLPGVSGTITLTTSEVAITDAVTISGPGAGLLTISGDQTTRIFNTRDAVAATVINLSGMTLTKGIGTGFSSGSKIGGGALVMGDESLTITDCVLIGNKTPAHGGAVGMSDASGGNLTAIRCTFAGNKASQSSGGAISSPFGANVNTIVMRDCTVTNNSARNAGGVYAWGDLFIENCVINNNLTTGGPSLGGGGGLAVRGATGTPTIRNSTISGNTASGNGAGMYLYNTAGTVLVHNCTITNNSAGTGLGGAIARSGSTNTIELESSIVSGNHAGLSGPELFTAGTVNAKTSLIGSVSGVTTFSPDAVTASLLGKAPQLGPLAYNGGPTQTHALLSGSPAIDLGSNPGGLTADQRGFARTIGTGPDIGAFELQPAAKVTAVFINDDSAQRSRVTNVTVTFDSPVGLPAAPAEAFQLQRQSDNAIVELAAAVTNTTTTSVTLTFPGTLAESGSLPDGRYTLTVLSAKVANINGTLDGNGDGVGGDDYVLVGDPNTNKLFRLFGDADGDNDVDTADFGAFRAAFGSTSGIFDFDNDGDVDTSDFGQFRGRFGSSI